MREAVINAIVHNDYTHEIPPKFEIFADRIEITSAGSLPDNISYDEFFEGISVPRNKELMRIFKDLDLVEQLGSGIPRILETYGRDCVNFTGNFIRMSFNAAGNVHEISDEDENTNLKQTSGLVDGLVDRLVDELVESQKLILKLIEENPKISKREMSEKIGISSNAVDKNLKTLKSKQIIRRKGNDKTGYWEVLYVNF